MNIITDYKLITASVKCTLNQSFKHHTWNTLLRKNHMHHRGNTLKSRALATYASVPLLSEGGVGDTSYSVR